MDAVKRFWHKNYIYFEEKNSYFGSQEFLMNQWIERIEEFLDPSTRVGKIQANVCDIEDKDIVIGMIQTMYNKEFHKKYMQTLD